MVLQEVVLGAIIVGQCIYTLDHYLMDPLQWHNLHRNSAAILVHMFN